MAPLGLGVRSRLRSLASARRLGQFLAVGAVGAAWDNAVLALLHGGMAVALLPAKVASAETAIVVMFVLNDRWTFAGEGADGVAARLRRLLASNAVRLGGLAVGVGVLLGLNRWFGVWYLAANVAGLAAGFACNYLLESLVTWRVGGRRDGHG